MARSSSGWRRLREPVQAVSLRAQFALVIGLLSFLPNVVVVLALVRLSGVGALNAVLAWMLLVAAVSGAVGYALSSALLRPLTRLTKEIDAGRPGEVRVDDPGEVRSLRGAFSRLLGRLGQEQGRRNAFVATLVHDLKTPLIATGYLIGALRDLPLGAAERAEVSGQLLDENARLLHLVRQMAEAHKFERGGVPMRHAPLDLAELGARLLARFQGRARERGVTLALSGGGHAGADAEQLDRALSNLLDNAVRYAASGVRLELAGRRLAVRDDGPGLAGALHDLAQPFNAQPALIAGQHYTAGTAGLGLFIARSVAEAHGGALAYRREEGWSTFEIDLGEIDLGELDPGQA